MASGVASAAFLHRSSEPVDGAPITYAPPGLNAGAGIDLTAPGAVQSLAVVSDPAITAATLTASTDPHAPPGQILTIRTGVSPGESTSEAEWAAYIAAAALHDRGQEQHLQISGTALRIALPNGSTKAAGIYFPDKTAADQSFTGPADVGRATELVTASAQAAGLEVESVRFQRGLQLAPVMTVVAPVPAAWKTVDLTRVFGPESRWEGWYLIVKDASGKRVIERGAVYRAGLFLADSDPAVL